MDSLVTDDFLTFHACWQTKWCCSYIFNCTEIIYASRTCVSTLRNYDYQLQILWFFVKLFWSIDMSQLLFLQCVFLFCSVYICESTFCLSTLLQMSFVFTCFTFYKGLLQTSINFSNSFIKMFCWIMLSSAIFFYCTFSNILLLNFFWIFQVKYKVLFLLKHLLLNFTL